MFEEYSRYDTVLISIKLLSEPAEKNDVIFCVKNKWCERTTCFCGHSDNISTVFMCIFMKKTQPDLKQISCFHIYIH